MLHPHVHPNTWAEGASPQAEPVSPRCLRITVDVEIKGESIEGQVASPSGQVPFSGWLGLLAELDEIIAGDSVGDSSDASVRTP